MDGDRHRDEVRDRFRDKGGGTDRDRFKEQGQVRSGKETGRGDSHRDRGVGLRLEARIGTVTGIGTDTRT
jgi:hypothetical protein